MRRGSELIDSVFEVVLYN